MAYSCFTQHMVYMQIMNNKGLNLSQQYVIMTSCIQCICKSCLHLLSGWSDSFPAVDTVCSKSTNTHCTVNCFKSLALHFLFFFLPFLCFTLTVMTAWKHVHYTTATWITHRCKLLLPALTIVFIHPSHFVINDWYVLKRLNNTYAYVFFFCWVS